MCVCLCVFVCVCVCVYVERSCTTRISRGSARALAGSWQQRHASLHSHAALCTSAVTLTPTSRRPSSISRGVKQECSGLFRRGVPSGAMCRSRGPPPASSSPLGAYSSPVAHRITPQSNKPPRLAAVYIFSRRAASSPIRIETRLGSRHKRASHAACISYLRRR